jgi:hypothetical protein
MNGHLIARRRALLEFAVVTTDPTSTPETTHAAAVRALEAAFRAEFGLSTLAPDDARLTGLLERFKTAIGPGQVALFGSAS